MSVLIGVSETADWLAGANKRSTLLSVADRFLYLDLALGNDTLLITSQVGFTIGHLPQPQDPARQLERSGPGLPDPRGHETFHAG